MILKYIFLFLTFSLVAHCQKITETQWFFGNSIANMQFDKNSILVYEEERMNQQFGIGGPAVISDEFSGNLFIYSDGVNIYDASHQETIRPKGEQITADNFHLAVNIYIR